MSDFDSIVNDVVLHSGDHVQTPLARSWVDRTWEDLRERRRWSWKVRRGQFILPDVYATGTATAEQGSDLIVLSGATLTSDMEGRQFRIGNSPVYTIKRVNYPAAGYIQLWQAWGPADATDLGYEIYQAYVTPPDDFRGFDSIVSPSLNYQLYFGVEARQLDQDDPERTESGDPYILASADYSPAYSGLVAAPLQVSGSGAVPVSGGDYSGANDALFVVEITTGGASGTAVFKWRKDSGSYVTGITTAEAGNDLQDDVQIAFPSGVTYDLGDIFIVSATARPSSGRPRFEVWPHVKTSMVLPYLYIADAGNLSVIGSLPHLISRTAVLEGALGRLARWPGYPGTPNPYFQQGLADSHERRFERFCATLENRDDEVYPQDVSYYRNLPYYQRGRRNLIPDQDRDYDTY